MSRPSKKAARPKGRAKKPLLKGNVRSEKHSASTPEPPHLTPAQVAMANGIAVGSDEERPRETAANLALARGDSPPPSINISRLQEMSMSDLNKMAKDMEIENFGTMRKQEVIFQILQRNAERSGILFAEGVLELSDVGWD